MRKHKKRRLSKEQRKFMRDCQKLGVPELAILACIQEAIDWKKHKAAARR